MAATMMAAVMATMVSPVMSHGRGWGGGGAVSVLRERKAAQAEQKDEREH